MKRLLTILVFLCAALPLRATPAGVRSFEGGTVSSARSIICQIVIDPGPNPPANMILVEYLPPGWTVTAATWNGKSHYTNLIGDTVNWVFGVSVPVSAGTLRYTLQPNEALEREYALNGSLQFTENSVQISRAVTGESRLISCDEDSDGIPDDWERKYFNGNPVGANAHTDSDGDGMSNLEEYRARTNPMDAASRVALTGITPEGPDLRLRWTAAAGTQVEVRGKASLTDSASTLLRLTVHPADGETQLLLPAPAADPFFIFLKVRGR